MKFLIDTNIISELRKKQPNQNVLAWFKAQKENSIFLSCLTIGEIEYGIVKLNSKDQEQAKVLSVWLNNLQRKYAKRIIDLDSKTSLIWGKFMSIDANNPIDNIIAAQAFTNNLTLVTRNNKHVSNLPIKHLNPFDKAIKHRE